MITTTAIDMDTEALPIAEEATSESAAPARTARAHWGLCGLAMIAVVVLAEHYAHLLDGNISDDAMTSMQYAKNLALGNGLVFNVGERVEGYTNFLWVLVMTPLYALSKAYGLPFVPIVNQLNIAFAAAITGLVYW